jgi:pseudaminic acid cytidylyltransferase
MNTLALIPARGGSKRVPRKNVRPFAGKPMIGHAIDVAQRSGLFDAVVVSTDEEIADIARRFGAEVPFMRPAPLADDQTPTVPVVAHAVVQMHTLGRTFERVCCLYPACPLLEPGDLQQALQMLEATHAPYVFPVLPFPAPIQRALRRAEDGRTEPFDPRHSQTRSQDLEPAYHDAGQFYWGRSEAWLQGLDIHRNGRTIVMPGWRAVDIDTPDDWLRAEALYRVLRQQSGQERT